MFQGPPLLPPALDPQVVHKYTDQFLEALGKHGEAEGDGGRAGDGSRQAAGHAEELGGQAGG